MDTEHLITVSGWNYNQRSVSMRSAVELFAHRTALIGPYEVITVRIVHC